MKKFSLYLVLAMVLVSVLPLGAKGVSEESKKDEKITLRIYTQYTDESEIVPMDYAVAEMKKLMPNVEIEIEVAGRDDNQKIKTYAAAGGLPDIFGANTDVLETFRKSNNIMPLNDAVTKAGVESLLSPATQKRLYHEDGNIYGMPSVGPWVALMYYNKEIFEANNVKIPENYGEFLAAVKAFASKDIIPLSLFAKEKWPGVQLFDMISTRYDAGGVKNLDQKKALMSDKAYAGSVARLEELLDAGLLVPGAFSTGYDQAYAQFVEGKAAMLLNGAWALSSLYDDMGDKVAVFEGYPLADKGSTDGVRWNMSGGPSPGGFAVSPYSDHKEIAAEYAVMLGMKFAEGGTLKLGFPPITRDASEPEAGYNPLQKSFWSTAGNIETTTIFPWGLTNAKIKTNLEDDLQKLMARTMTGDEFIREMDKVINK